MCGCWEYDCPGWSCAGACSPCGWWPPAGTYASPSAPSGPSPMRNVTSDGGGASSGRGAHMITVLALALLVASLAGVSIRGRPVDLYAASREVSPWWNASAISGEYISAGAFLGIAGLVLAYGADMLWLPIGAAAGHVVLLALVTA